MEKNMGEMISEYIWSRGYKISRISLILKKGGDRKKKVDLELSLRELKIDITYRLKLKQLFITYNLTLKVLKLKYGRIL